MSEFSPIQISKNPKLSQNIFHFARALRKAGLEIGTGRVIDAIKAVLIVGFSNKKDFYWVLHACFVSKPEHIVIFDQIFRLFWRDPQYLEKMMSIIFPTVKGVQKERKGQAGEKRAAESLLNNEFQTSSADGEDKQDSVVEVNSSFTMSETERLKTLDFELMSSQEIEQAKKMLENISFDIKPNRSRRKIPHANGDILDRKATLRLSRKFGGEIPKLSFKKQIKKWPNLVVLCDISGSMSQYSRMFLHFLHAISNKQGKGWAKVHAFTFGTQLTNITRHLKSNDVDFALAKAGQETQDWGGGTRISACVHFFNRNWSKRVMGQGSVALLITDGLERDQFSDLGHEINQLRMRSKRLIWLNPLLRWEEFSVKAKGIKAILPHVDSFISSHSIESLENLARIISQPCNNGEKSRLLKSLV